MTVLQLILAAAIEADANDPAIQAAAADGFAVFGDEVSVDNPLQFFGIRETASIHLGNLIAA